MKERKSFSEISPLTYAISREKEILKRNLQDLVHRVRFAQTIQTEKLFVFVDGEYLQGELYATREQPYAYHVRTEGEFFAREADGNVYRNGTVVREVVEKETGKIVDHQVLRTNHAKVLYDVPEEKLS